MCMGGYKFLSLVLFLIYKLVVLNVYKIFCCFCGVLASMCLAGLCMMHYIYIHLSNRKTFTKLKISKSKQSLIQTDLEGILDPWLHFQYF